MKIRPANEQNLSRITSWFSNEEEVKQWGGPSVTFPLNLTQLKNDIEWENAQSYAFFDERDTLIGFLQVFNKFGYKHFGRIVVSPKMRGQKFGHKLMVDIITLIGRQHSGFSLFVYEENVTAKRLYENIGFVTQKHPDGEPRREGCLFMVKKT